MWRRCRIALMERAVREPAHDLGRRTPPQLRYARAAAGEPDEIAAAVVAVWERIRDWKATTCK